MNECRSCGCTDDDCLCCIIATDDPCYWAEPDLCDVCAGDEPCPGMPETIPPEHLPLIFL